MRLYATATANVTREGKAQVRLHLCEAESREQAEQAARNQHHLATESPPDDVACVEATSCPTYGKLKLFAVSTWRMSEVGVIDSTLRVVEAHSREVALRDARAAAKLADGREPERVDLLEIPKPDPYPPMTEWVKAACINPRVGGPLLAGVIDLLCQIDRERALPAESMFGEGPVARLYAGLQMVERAWHELPVHRPDDPHAGESDGH